MSDAINPNHYITHPEGVHAECIEYTRVINAFAPFTEVPISRSN